MAFLLFRNLATLWQKDFLLPAEADWKAKELGVRTSRRRWLRRSVIFVIVAIGLWLLASLTAVYWLTRRPHPVFAEPPPDVPWGQAQAIRLTTGDGEELGAWFFPGRHDQPLVLLLHGNRGCRRDCLPQAKILACGLPGVAHLAASPRRLDRRSQ
jgi:hypothetical protein